MSCYTNLNSITDKNVVLDLDETLVHSFTSVEHPIKVAIQSEARYLKLRRRLYTLALEGSGITGYPSKIHLWGVFRPNLPDFISFCCSYFRTVSVWSAGEEEYVRQISTLIFRDSPCGSPSLLYARSKVERSANNTNVKPLSKMFLDNCYGDYSPLQPHNTFILDDNPDTMQLNRDNGIIIPAYTPEATVRSISNDNTAFEKLKIWLMKREVAMARDVRSLNKSEIFI